MEDLIHNLNTMDWSNIQEPVKLLISSMVEVISKQRKDIEELKANTGILTLNNIQSTFHNELIKYGVTKSDVDSLITKVDAIEKVNNENKLSIKEIKVEMDFYNEQMDIIKKKVDYYIKTLKTMESHIMTEVETNISNKILHVNNKVQQMEIMNAKSSISKDELYLLLSQKASLSEIEGINEAIVSCVAKHEFQQELNYQILPLTKALSSLEKLIQIQSSVKTDKIKVNFDTTAPDIKLIENIINTIILERNFCECKSVDIHSSITEIYERILAEIRSSNEILRLDMVTTFNDEISQFVNNVDNKIKYSETKILEKLKKMVTKSSQLTDKLVTKTEFEKWQNSNSSKQFGAFDQQIFQNDMNSNNNLAHFDSFSEYSNILDKSVHTNNANKMHHEINELKTQLNNTKNSVENLILNQKKENHAHTSPEDWRIALGDMTSNIKAELKQKIAREEMISIIDNTLKNDLHTISQNVDEVKKIMETKTNEKTTQLIQEEVTALTKRFVNNFAEGRWLCTNHNDSCIRDDGFILWDSEMYNSTPSMFSFKKMNSYLQVKVPGLYR